MGIDPITRNFIFQMTSLGVASLIGIISALSACFLKSRCTHISSPCITCDRDVLDIDAEANTRENSSTDVTIPIPIPTSKRNHTPLKL